MDKSTINNKLKSIVTTLKPWLLALAFVLVLKYTGALSGIAFFTQSAAMETGLMDIAVDDKPATESFDYNFLLKDMEGNTINANTLKGKVVFLNLWATWCGPCRVEMPSIQELYNEKKDSVMFVMISLDAKNQEHKIQKYIDDKGFTFPVYTLASSPTAQLNVPSIPTTFVISKDGQIRSKKIGAANYNTKKFRKMLDELTDSR